MSIRDLYWKNIGILGRMYVRWTNKCPLCGSRTMDDLNIGLKMGMHYCPACVDEFWANLHGHDRFGKPLVKDQS